LCGHIEYTFAVENADPSYSTAVAVAPMPEGSAFDYRYARRGLTDRECTWGYDRSWVIRSERAPYLEDFSHAVTDSMSGADTSTWESTLANSRCTCPARYKTHPMCTP
jgi:hypothetical protein